MSERKLVGTQEMFKKALEGGYAIGAYNVNNMEILQGKFGLHIFWHLLKLEE